MLLLVLLLLREKNEDQKIKTRDGLGFDRCERDEKPNEKNIKPMVMKNWHLGSCRWTCVRQMFLKRSQAFLDKSIPTAVPPNAKDALKHLLKADD